MPLPFLCIVPDEPLVAEFITTTNAAFAEETKRSVNQIEKENILHLVFEFTVRLCHFVQSFNRYLLLKKCFSRM